MLQWPRVEYQSHRNKAIFSSVHTALPCTPMGCVSQHKGAKALYAARGDAQFGLSFTCLHEQDLLLVHQADIHVGCNGSNVGSARHILLTCRVNYP